jgi:hypothetical protein
LAGTSIRYVAPSGSVPVKVFTPDCAEAAGEKHKQEARTRRNVANVVVRPMMILPKFETTSRHANAGQEPCAAAKPLRRRNTVGEQ